LSYPDGYNVDKNSSTQAWLRWPVSLLYLLWFKKKSMIQVILESQQCFSSVIIISSPCPAGVNRFYLDYQDQPASPCSLIHGLQSVHIISKIALSPLKCSKVSYINTFDSPFINRNIFSYWITFKFASWYYM
jgi:hypothetical protein